MGFLAGLEGDSNVGAGVRSPSYASRLAKPETAQTLEKAVGDLRQSVREIEGRIAGMLESRLGKFSIEASSPDILMAVSDAAGSVSSLVVEAKVRSVTGRELLDALAQLRTSAVVVRVFDESAIVRLDPGRFASFLDRIVTKIELPETGTVGVIAINRGKNVVLSVRRLTIRPESDERALAALSVADPVLQVAVPIIPSP